MPIGTHPMGSRLAGAELRASVLELEALVSRRAEHGIRGGEWSCASLGASPEPEAKKVCAPGLHAGAPLAAHCRRTPIVRGGPAEPPAHDPPTAGAHGRDARRRHLRPLTRDRRPAATADVRNAARRCARPRSDALDGGPRHRPRASAGARSVPARLSAASVRAMTFLIRQPPSSFGRRRSSARRPCSQPSLTRDTQRSSRRAPTPPPLAGSGASARRPIRAPLAPLGCRAPPRRGGPPRPPRVPPHLPSTWHTFAIHLAHLRRPRDRSAEQPAAAALPLPWSSIWRQMSTMPYVDIARYAAATEDDAENAPRYSPSAAPHDGRGGEWRLAEAAGGVGRRAPSISRTSRRDLAPTSSLERAAPSAPLHLECWVDEKKERGSGRDRARMCPRFSREM